MAVVPESSPIFTLLKIPVRLPGKRMILVKTPFDEVIDNIVTEHYHNHRQETHSDLVSQGIFRDLMQKCPELRT